MAQKGTARRVPARSVSKDPLCFHASKKAMKLAQRLKSSECTSRQIALSVERDLMRYLSRKSCFFIEEKFWKSISA
jgi:hypothetical protein